MSFPTALGTAFVAGILLGIFVFGSLWWTLRHAVVSSNAALWFGVGALLRVVAVFATFYYMLKAGLPSVAACLLGLLSARFAVTRVIRSMQGRLTSDPGQPSRAR